MDKTFTGKKTLIIQLKPVTFQIDCELSEARAPKAPSQSAREALSAFIHKNRRQCIKSLKNSLETSYKKKNNILFFIS